MMDSNSFFLSLLIFLLKISIFINCDIFTSQEEFLPLLNTQKHIVKYLDNFINVEENRLLIINNFVSSLEKEGTLLKNPVEAFKIIKTLTNLDYLFEKNLVQEDNWKGLENNITFIKSTPFVIFPKIEDLNGSAVALGRLQHTYILNTTLISTGDILGHLSEKLTYEDVYEIAFRNFFGSKFKTQTVAWLAEAVYQIQKLIEKLERPNKKLIDLKQKALTLFKESLNNLEVEQLEIVNNLIEKYSNNQRPIDENILKELFDVTSAKGIDDGTHFSNHNKYKALCRGEFPKLSGNLKCYLSRKENYAKISPIKFEVLNEDPEILMFHDIIFNSEIQKLIELSLAKLHRSEVISKSKIKQTRISKTAWLEDNESPILPKVHKRMQLNTKLSLKNNTEITSIINYGIGGFFLYHPDFFIYSDLVKINITNSLKRLKEQGNRIATFMIYLSNVEAGGATVFPNLNLTIWPNKGSGVFWYNLKDDGEGDPLSVHAGCPVLVGNKWILNKWIRERGEEFTRPCLKRSKNI